MKYYEHNLILILHCSYETDLDRGRQRRRENGRVVPMYGYVTPF